MARAYLEKSERHRFGPPRRQAGFCGSYVEPLVLQGFTMPRQLDSLFSKLRKE
jgi:hypothetical protein